MKFSTSFRMGLLICLLLFGRMICFGAQRAHEYRFFKTPLAQVLREISFDFGTTIIADPSLPGLVTGNIISSSVEKVLQAILEPLGYSYTKVDDFYLVNGKDTPLKIYNGDSAVIHFGSMSPGQREQLIEYQRYMVYDETSGVVFVKAPTGIIAKILAKIRELKPETGPALVAYSFRIIDLNRNSALQAGLQGLISNEPFTDGDAIITPGNAVFKTLKNRLEVAGNSSSDQNHYLARPWLLAAAGKQTRLASLLHYPGDETGRDREFVLKLTPISIDAVIGQVVSEVSLEYNRDQVGKLVTILHSTPGQYQLIAVLRRRDRLPEHTLARKESRKQERDFAVFMAATPVDISKISSCGTAKPFMGAYLDGFGEFTASHGGTLPREPELGFGFHGTSGCPWTPWFRLKIPLKAQGDLNIRYQSVNDYAIGLTGFWDESRETSWELMAGYNIGFGDKPVVMFGLGDVYQPTRFLTLSGKYFPVICRLDSGQLWESSAIWEGGLRLGTSQFGISANFFGNPNPFKTGLSFDYQNKNFGWSLGVMHEYTSPDVDIRVGAKLKL
jgi:hypothetical protein